MLFVFYVPEMGNIILRDFFKKTLTNRLVGIIIITVTVPIIFYLFYSFQEYGRAGFICTDVHEGELYDKKKSSAGGGPAVSG